LDLAVSTTDLVIEAAVEDLEIKRKIFEQLDQAAPAHAILSTNSSNIMSSQIADATTRPDKVCNMHFFNPALVMEGVEVVPHAGTSQETTAATIRSAYCTRSEEHTSELQSRFDLVCRLLLEKKKMYTAERWVS